MNKEMIVPYGKEEIHICMHMVLCNSGWTKLGRNMCAQTYFEPGRARELHDLVMTNYYLIRYAWDSRGNARTANAQCNIESRKINESADNISLIESLSSMPIPPSPLRNYRWYDPLAIPHRKGCIGEKGCISQRTRAYQPYTHAHSRMLTYKYMHDTHMHAYICMHLYKPSSA